MPTSDADLARVVSELRDAVTALRLELVRKDVYEAHRVADKDEVADVRRSVDKIVQRLDTAETEARTNRRLMISAFVMPLVVQLLMLYVISQVGR